PTLGDLRHFFNHDHRVPWSGKGIACVDIGEVPSFSELYRGGGRSIAHRFSPQSDSVHRRRRVGWGGCLSPHGLRRHPSPSLGDGERLRLSPKSERLTPLIQSFLYRHII